MCTVQNTMQLRNCYDNEGRLINEHKIKDFEPLKKLLQQFGNAKTEISGSLDKAG